MPGKRISTNNRGTDLFGVISGKARQFRASLGKPQTPVLFSASGGTESTPGDGYKYHVYSPTTPSTFVVASGSKQIEIMLQGGGGGGQGGWGPSATGGGGGGGGATGAWTINDVVAGTYTMQIGTGSGGGGGGGAGSSGGPTKMVHPNQTSMESEGGNPSASQNNSLWVDGSYVLVSDYPGDAAGYRAANNDPRNGDTGKNAGGHPAPNSLWWKSYIGTATGGLGGVTPSGTAANGNPYGSGGGGGRGNTQPSGAPNGPGGSGAPGTAVIRYLV